MPSSTPRTHRVSRTLFLVWATVVGAGLSYADRPREVSAHPTENELWRQTTERTAKGEFDGAIAAIKQIHDGGRVTEQVRTWLKEYEAKQAARRALDREDFDKYVGYAKARVERVEFRRALRWALAALDCTHDRDGFLSSDWMSDLVNDALGKANAHRREGEWRDAWRIYSLLSRLYEREPRYRKLDREAVTHVRLDAMFKEGAHWEDRIEKVRWKDAERAFSYLDTYYIEPVDFKALAESGLEQLLLLADSKTAREHERLKGLANEDDRNDFKTRLQQRLDQVRAAPRLDYRDCVGHFRRVVNKINVQTVRLPEGLIVSELMRGALDPLDDFTTIIWPIASKEFDKHTRGDFVGVGISIIKNRAGEIEVVTPLEGTPAYRAGIQAGDIIAKVDGTAIKGYSITKVVETITGPKDTPVTLTIRRDGTDIEFDLVRARVKIRSVKGVRRDPIDEERWDHWLDKERGIGYVRITNFQRNTVEDVQNALSELPRLAGLVLDLRGNPGGLLDAATQLSELFLEAGEVVVSTKGVIKREDRTFDVAVNGAYCDVPMVVLVDERSASASEIVSGAIRDNRRGTVVGERTFGKFSVQNLINLGSSRAKLKITTASYFLPNGDSLHRNPDSETWGVIPDILVRLVRWETYNVWQMQREANLLGPPKSETKEDEASDKKQDSEKTVDDEADDSEKTAKAESDGQADDEADDESESDTETVATADEGELEEDKLPPLEQPDENNRPKEDPQLDTALLLLRIKVLAQSHPTLATAGISPAKEGAKP